MPSYLVQLLLPLQTSRGAAVSVAEVARTRDELVAAFGGATAYLRSPGEGTWTPPEGGAVRDDVLMVEVLTDRFDAAWWRDYGRRLARRFDQREMHIRALPALVPETEEP